MIDVAIITAIVVGGFCCFIKWKSVMRRHEAAVNVVLAKHTYGVLSDTDKRRVHEQAVDILNRVRRGGYREFDNETERIRVVRPCNG